MEHPTFDGRPVQIGDLIRTSNDQGWQQVEEIRWNGGQQMIWLHARRPGEAQRNAEVILAQPAEGYAYIVALRTPEEVAALLRDVKGDR